MATNTIDKREPAKTETREIEQSRVVYQPAVDILELEDELQVIAELPGSTAENIDVSLEDGLLTVCGRVAPRRPQQATNLLQEYGVGDFRRTFTVGKAIDDSALKAEYRDGVLTLHLPKVETAKTRRIRVKPA